MAEVATYTYRVDQDASPEVILASDEIHIVSKDGKLVYAYFAEDKLVFPRYIPDAYTGDWNLEPMSPEEFLKRWRAVQGAKILLITNHTLSLQGLGCVAVTNYIDYPKMIDDLERAGKIKTKPSNSFLATDPRKFWFLGDTQEYEVDCLGTGLCKYISEKVLDGWLEITNPTSLK